MSFLRVFLFGHVRVAHSDRPTEVKVTPTSQALLAYLLLQPNRTCPREVLAAVFWGDHSQERARSCLNSALWRLRQALEPEAIPADDSFLLTTSTDVGFNWHSSFWLDVAAFEGQVNRALAVPVQAMTATHARQLEDGLQLYTAELLEGHYDDWALHERERLRRLYLNGLAHLMYYYKHQGAYPAGLACGQRILDQDPLREEIHRDMMRFYAGSGQRTLALRQYETCRKALAVELSISPMAETQQLYAQVVQEADSSQSSPPPVEEQPVGYQQVLQQLRLALGSFNQAQQQLQQAIQAAERFLSCSEQEKIPHR